MNLVGPSWLVERKRLEGGTLEGARDALRRSGCVRVGEEHLAFDRVRLGEIQVRLVARARERDVPPFAQVSVIAEEDVGVVEGGALGGVAGERVGVVEVLCRVGGGQLARKPGVNRTVSVSLLRSIATMVPRIPLRTPSSRSFLRQRTRSPTRYSRSSSSSGSGPSRSA